MIYLINKKMEPKMSFKIMENVRKGKGLTEEFEKAMKQNNVPNWYIESCKKIKYMFPKAHAAAYVMMAYRIAYYKVYYPAAFYATFYTVRADNFDSTLMIHGKQKVKNAIKEYEQKTNLSQTEKDTLTILEVVNEMYERGIKFLPIDIEKSDSERFLIEDGDIRPPISSIPGVGNVVASSIVKNRKDGKYSTIEELAIRAKVGKSTIKVLEENGCLEHIPKNNQISLF